MESAFADLVLEPADIKDGRIRKIYYDVQFDSQELDWISRMRREAAV
jgi:hypothetical protein